MSVALYSITVNQSLPSRGLKNSNFNCPKENIEKNTEMFFRSTSDYRGNVDKFICELENHLVNSKDKIHLNAVSVLLKTTNSYNSNIHDALYKNEGYVSRLFTSESWGEWWENRTPLGKVAFAFNEYLWDLAGYRSTFGQSNPLDPGTIQRANHEAQHLLIDLEKSNIDRLLQIFKNFINSLPSFSFPMAQAIDIVLQEPCSLQELTEFTFVTKSLNESIGSFHKSFDIEDLLKLLVTYKNSNRIELINPKKVERINKIVCDASEIFKLINRCPYVFSSYEASSEYEVLSRIIDYKHEFGLFYKMYTSRKRISSEIKNLEENIENGYGYIRACNNFIDFCNSVVGGDDVLQKIKESRDVFYKYLQAQLTEIDDGSKQARIENEEYSKKICALNAQLSLGIPIAIQKQRSRLENDSSKNTDVENSINELLSIYDTRYYIKTGLEGDRLKNERKISDYETLSQVLMLKYDLFFNVLPLELVDEMAIKNLVEKIKEETRLDLHEIEQKNNEFMTRKLELEGQLESQTYTTHG